MAASLRPADIRVVSGVHQWRSLRGSRLSGSWPGGETYVLTVPTTKARSLAITKDTTRDAYLDVPRGGLRRRNRQRPNVQTARHALVCSRCPPGG